LGGNDVEQTGLFLTWATIPVYLPGGTEDQISEFRFEPWTSRIRGRNSNRLVRLSETTSPGFSSGTEEKHRNPS
jgi:hypothetical protein